MRLYGKIHLVWVSNCVVVVFCIHMFFLVCFNWCTFEYEMNTKHSSTCLYLLWIRKADSSNLVDDSIDHQYGSHFYGKLKFYDTHTAFTYFNRWKCTRTNNQHQRDEWKKVTWAIIAVMVDQSEKKKYRNALNGISFWWGKGWAVTHLNPFLKTWSNFKQSKNHP